MEWIDWVYVAIPIVVVALFLIKGLRLINDDEVGILYKKMLGAKMPQGQVVARKGEVGVQANILMPALYWRIPIIWRIDKEPVTVILPTEIGVVESIDGVPISKGRLLGDEVECNHFQDAKAFLDNNGMKGPQVATLRPGTYRINTYAFKVMKQPVTQVPAEKIGVVVALDGRPLLSELIVAPRPKTTATRDHRFFQDGQAFLDTEGSRGPQLDTLQPGRYYINPLLYKVDIYDQAEVPPGYVAVLRSNVGAELVKAEGSPIPNVGAVGPPEIAKTETNKQLVAIDQPVHEDVETLLILDRDQRGIYKEPIAPGKYNINPLAFTAYLVPTSAVTIDWAQSMERGALHETPSALKSLGVVKSSSEAYDEVSDKASEFFKFSQLRVTSMDGFQLDVDVRMVIRIRPANAAFIIARFGSVKNLIEQIVHPLIDSSFRNKAGEEKAINFIMGRTVLQQDALKKAQAQFAIYHVEAQNLLIAYIKVDQNLLDTQTRREIALQQQAQYEQEALAQEKRIEVQAKAATADKQPDVIAAKLSINIEESKADAKRQTAGGDRDYLKMVADGEAYKQREVGQGIADAYRAQTEVLGPPAIAAIKLMSEVGTNKVKITPDIMITGAGGDAGVTPMLTTWLAQTVGKNLKEAVPLPSETNEAPKERTPTPQYEPAKKETPKKDLKETTK